MLDLSKKIISYVVIFSLVLSLSSFAYADDTESDLTGDSPVSSDTVSEADLEMLDNELHSTANSLTALLNASNDNVTYTTDDIYNLLKYYFDWDFWNHGSGSGQTWTSVTYNRLGDIVNYLRTINTSANAIVTKITELASRQSDISSTLGADWNVSLRQAIDDIYQELKLSVTVDGQIVTYSVAEMLLNIQYKLNDVYSEIVTIEDILANTYNVIQTINSVINTISNLASNIATNTANTITAVDNNTSAINNFNNDFNNITWLNGGEILGYSSSLNNSLSNNYDLTNGSIITSDIYIKLRLPSGNNIYKLSPDIQVQNSSINGLYVNLEFYSSVGTNITSALGYYYTSVASSKSDLYFYNVNGGVIIVKINNPYRLVYGLNSHLYYIPFDNIDSYLPLTYVNFNRLLNIANKFEYLYASDDLIKSKDAQQPLEDQVLKDFTGNGSASAKLSDAASAKDASSALESGLNTGYSASDALSVFNSFQASDFGFFAWFSPENATYFNNNSNKNLLKSNMGVDDDYTSIVWTDSVPDVTSDIDRLYIEGMNYGQSD